MDNETSIPQDFKDKVDEVLAMCDDKQCYQYLADKVEEKSEEYEQDDKQNNEGDKPSNDDTGTVKEFSMNDAPSTMD